MQSGQCLLSKRTFGVETKVTYRGLFQSLLIMINVHIFSHDSVLTFDLSLPRVLFGSNHLYVFHHPQDEAKNVKEGKVVKEPTYDEAQEEIVKQSGLVKDGANKSQGALIWGGTLVFQVMMSCVTFVPKSTECYRDVNLILCFV